MIIKGKDGKLYELVGEKVGNAFVDKLVPLSTVSKRFDPDQPRDPHTGEWIDTFSALRALRTEMVDRAQTVYDEWDQGEDGLDDEYGSGGICDDIASEIGGTIAENLGGNGVEVLDGGMEGDDHAWVMVVDRKSKRAWRVDIPYNTYESGQGYDWSKIEGVKFTPDDVEIEEVDSEIAAEYLQEADELYGVLKRAGLTVILKRGKCSAGWHE